MLIPNAGLTLFVAAWAGFAAAPSEERFFAEARILRPVHVRAPKVKAGAEPPLLVCLHGKGGTVAGLADLWDALKDPKPILAIPEAPYALGFTSNPPTMGWSWDFPSEDRKLWKIADPLVVRYILDVVRETQKKHPSRGAFLLGHSQGVAYAFMAALQEPELINGVIAFAGILPTDMIPEEAFANAAGKVRIFLAHGREDKSIEMRSSTRAQEFLEKRGFSVVFKSFPGGHELNVEALREAQAWMMTGEPDAR